MVWFTFNTYVISLFLIIQVAFPAKPNRNLKHIKLQIGPMYVYDTPLLTRHMRVMAAGITIVKIISSWLLMEHNM